MITLIVDKDRIVTQQPITPDGALAVVLCFTVLRISGVTTWEYASHQDSPCTIPIHCPDINIIMKRHDDVVDALDEIESAISAAVKSQVGTQYVAKWQHDEQGAYINDQEGWIYLCLYAEGGK